VPTNVVIQAHTLCVLLTATCLGLRAQVPVFTDLTINVENVVEYQADIAGPSALAKKPDITAARGNLAINPNGIANFPVWTAIGDIVAVNGRDDKGLMVLRAARSTHRWRLLKVSA
jgi:hypothetical protein